MSDVSKQLFGDHLLSVRLQEELDGTDHLGACVALVSPRFRNKSLIAGVGVSPDLTFNIGSIGKALNGLIYSSMIVEGKISGEDTLNKFLSLADVSAGTTTLESLVTHTSGLPSVGGGLRALFRTRWRLLCRKDPQPENLNEFISQLRKARVQDKRFNYSNFGGAALGHALAAVDGVPYPELIANRFAKPLNCPSLNVPVPGCPELSNDVPSLSIFETKQEPWAGEGYAPAGGIRASAVDMAIVLDAILNNPLPGWVNAFVPLKLTDMDNAEGLPHAIGAGWFIQEASGTTGELAWHNGVAAGFCSAIVLDRKRRCGAFISIRDGSMQADSVSAALALLGDEASFVS